MFNISKYKIADEMDLRGILVMISEYCYFRVTLDMSQADFNLTCIRSINDLITYVPKSTTILKIFLLRISTCCGQYMWEHTIFIQLLSLKHRKKQFRSFSSYYKQIHSNSWWFSLTIFSAIYWNAYFTKHKWYVIMKIKESAER